MGALKAASGSNSFYMLAVLMGDVAGFISTLPRILHELTAYAIAVCALRRQEHKPKLSALQTDEGDNPPKDGITFEMQLGCCPSASCEVGSRVNS